MKCKISIISKIKGETLMANINLIKYDIKKRLLAKSKNWKSMPESKTWHSH